MLKTTQKIAETQKHSSLDGMVREEIRSAIFSGELANGSHLSEIKLSKQYDVSRTPVREALAALCADGLVEMYPNRGAFVKMPDEQTQLQLTELYSFLMGLTARVASEKLSETDIARIERTINSMGNSTGMTFEDSRNELNHIISSIAANPPLVEMMSTVERRLPTPLFTPVTTNQQSMEMQQTYSYLLAAFKRSKSDTAEKAMRDVMRLSFTMAATFEEAGAA